MFHGGKGHRGENDEVRLRPEVAGVAVGRRRTGASR